MPSKLQDIDQRTGLCTHVNDVRDSFSCIVCTDTCIQVKIMLSSISCKGAEDKYQYVSKLTNA